MFTQTTTEENSTSGIMPPPASKIRWRVAQVDVIGLRTLQVRFLDGLSGKVRFENSYFEGVFEVLKNADLFNQAYVEQGAVTWPGELDLAPDAMYDEIKKNGEWILK